MKKDFILVIPNIRSAHNVGSLFRTADGAGVNKIYLAGHSPLPIDKFGRLSKPQKEIAKTALGAEKIIPYEYLATLKEVVKKLKKEGFVIIGLEQDERAIKIGSNFSIDSFQKNTTTYKSKKSQDKEKLKKILRDSKKIALVVGEEVEGMTKSDLKLMDYLIEIPMHGQKESLNVSVAGGVAMFWISSQLLG